MHPSTLSPGFNLRLVEALEEEEGEDEVLLINCRYELVILINCLYERVKKLNVSVVYQVNFSFSLYSDDSCRGSRRREREALGEALVGCVFC